MADDSGEIVREAAETASFANVKTLGEAVSFYTTQAMANSNMQQQQNWNLSNAITGKVVEKLLETSATEGAGPDVTALLALVKSLQSVQPIPSTQT